MKKIHLNLLFLFFASSFLFGQNALPLQPKDSTLQPLGKLLNQNLQIKLESELNKNLKLKNLIQRKKLASGIIDLRNQNNIAYARINGNNMMYAASLPKIAVFTLPPPYFSKLCKHQNERNTRKNNQFT